MPLKCKRTDELEKEIQTNDKTWGQMEGNNDRTPWLAHQTTW